MASSNFIDHVRIYANSGNGGPGSAHFRREKFVPFGGPDGGDGGRGGHIIVRGNQQLWTLLHLRYRKHLKGTHGEQGGGHGSNGKDGKDEVLEVPLGTTIIDENTGERLAEVTEDGQEVIILAGGKGGLGNVHFKSATRQSPTYAQPGLPGEERTIVLELKVLADVGLVGFPNAGKSTLLSVVSAAKPEIADYAFTTLVPNLGVVSYYDDQSFVMADIPGLIEGAADGKGLGTRFLRHVERNSVLLFVVSAERLDIEKEYKILLGELEQHNPELLDKCRVLAVSKCDLMDSELQEELKTKLPKGLPTVFISSHTQQGLKELKDLLWQTLHHSMD